MIDTLRHWLAIYLLIGAVMFYVLRLVDPHVNSIRRYVQLQMLIISMLLWPWFIRALALGMYRAFRKIKTRR